MKTSACIILLVVAVFAAKAWAQTEASGTDGKPCYDWDKLKAEKIEICNTCKKNSTKKEDIQMCFYDPKCYDDKGKFLKDKYIEEKLKCFSGDAATKSKLETGLKKCIEKEAKTEKEMEKRAECEVECFIENCPKMYDNQGTMYKAAELKDCVYADPE